MPQGRRPPRWNRGPTQAVVRGTEGLVCLDPGALDGPQAGSLAGPVGAVEGGSMESGGPWTVSVVFRHG